MPIALALRAGLTLRFAWPRFAFGGTRPLRLVRGYLRAAWVVGDTRTGIFSIPRGRSMYPVRARGLHNYRINRPFFHNNGRCRHE